MNDERLKQLMEQVGMPNSRSLYQALQQAEAEGAAIRDAEVAKLKDDNEHLYVAAIERDQLRKQVKMLRDALAEVLDGETQNDEDVLAIIHNARATLAATEPKP